MNTALAELRLVYEKVAEHEHCGLAIGAGQMPKVLRILDRAIEAFDEIERHLNAVIDEKETAMGKAAQAITELRGQLTTAQANAYDADDLAAIQGVLGTPVAPSSVPTPTPVVTDPIPAATPVPAANS